jgi:hypothetical protein
MCYQYAPEIRAKITASRQRAQARLFELKGLRMGEQEETHDGRRRGWPQR